MDRHFAVVAEGKERDARPRGTLKHLVWHDTTRWRVEVVRKSEPADPSPNQENATAWWHDYISGANTAIKIINDGRTECTYKRDRSIGNKPDPNNPDYLLIESYIETMRPHSDLEDPSAYDSELLAAWVGYPKLRAESMFEMNLNPASGPSGTILLTATRADYMQRVWLDPDRNYLAVRHEHRNIRKRRDLGTIDVLETIRTPSGRWLPSVVRITVSLGNGEQQVRYKNFFFKFDVKVDEKMFTVSDL